MEGSGCGPPTTSQRTELRRNLGTQICTRKTTLLFEDFTLALQAAAAYDFFSQPQLHFWRREPMSYRVCACLFVVFAIAGCGAPIGFAQADPVSIFRQAIDARNRGDLDGLMKFFASDAVREDGSCNPHASGSSP